MVENLAVGTFATVYDAEGNAIQLDHVDAREYLATGRYTAALVDPAVAAEKAAADEAVRKAAAATMTADKDGTTIREAHPLDHDGGGRKGGSGPRQTKKG